MDNQNPDMTISELPDSGLAYTCTGLCRMADRHGRRGFVRSSTNLAEDTSQMSHQ
jgi:hypothetical protein